MGPLSGLYKLQVAAGAGAVRPLPVTREVEGKARGLQRDTGKDSHQEYSKLAAEIQRAKWGGDLGRESRNSGCAAPAALPTVRSQGDKIKQ